MHTLFDFSMPAATAGWQAIDDAVMGGCSHSQLTHRDDGYAEFSGTVALANGGGFASVRSAEFAPHAHAVTHYLLQVRGDGQHYKFNLRHDPHFDGINYQVQFATTAGVWCTLRLPVAAFQPTVRGRVVTASPLRPQQVCQAGLMTAGRRPGRFALALRWIRSA